MKKSTRRIERALISFAVISLVMLSGFVLVSHAEGSDTSIVIFHVS